MKSDEKVNIVLPSRSRNDGEIQGNVMGCHNSIVRHFCEIKPLRGSSVSHVAHTLKPRVSATIATKNSGSQNKGERTR